jgi:hypothetical protein
MCWPDASQPALRVVLSPKDDHLVVAADHLDLVAVGRGDPVAIGVVAPAPSGVERLALTDAPGSVEPVRHTAYAVAVIVDEDAPRVAILAGRDVLEVLNELPLGLGHVSHLRRVEVAARRAVEVDLLREPAAGVLLPRAARRAEPQVRGHEVARDGVLRELRHADEEVLSRGGHVVFAARTRLDGVLGPRRLHRIVRHA